MHLFYHFYKIMSTEKRLEKTKIYPSMQSVRFRANLFSTYVDMFGLFPKEKTPLPGRFFFWSRRRESNSPEAAWEAAAIPLGDACFWVCLPFSFFIIPVFLLNVNYFFRSFRIFITQNSSSCYTLRTCRKIQSQNLQ